MDVCYCANYYSSVRCTNTVSIFGQRCKLCTFLKTGSSLSPGRLPDDLLWPDPSLRSVGEREEHPASAFIPVRRPSWPFGGLSLPLSRKPTLDGSIWKVGRVNPKA